MEFLPFFLILLATVLFASVFRTFHLPWVLALITAGVVIGPYGLGVTEVTPTMDFLGEIGLIFLMFMAGLETKFDSFKRYRSNIAWIATLSGLIPLLVGVGLGYLLDFSLIASALLGVIFMSSSIAVIIPTLEGLNKSHTKLGHSIIASAIVVDVASLILLSVLLQTVSPSTALPLPSFYFLLAVIMLSFAYALPKIRGLIPVKRDEKDLFESEVRVIFALIIGVVVTFELLGLHPIIAGFFAGLVLADSIKSQLLIDKLRTMSYGIFIPIFFVVVGMETDISVFSEGMGTLELIGAIIGASILAKLASGWLAGRITGFSQRDALLIGIATIPQLSTTLAVVFAAVDYGFLDPAVITAMVMLSVVTTLIAPIALRVITR